MDDRYQELDEFASQQAAQGGRLVPAFTVHPPPPQLFHGVVQVFAPRNEADVRAEIRAKAAAAGDDWYYRIPFRNKDGTTTFVEGPSKTLANDVLLAYRYAECDGWVSGEGPDFIEFTARFIDTERGIAMTRVFRQRKGASRVGTDKARNDEITFQIGMSKAIRNVICNALQSFTDFAFDEARKSIVDKIGRNLDGYRDRIVEKLKQKLDIVRVERVIGRAAADWLAPDVAQVIARMKGVEEGMASLDETFPPVAKEPGKTDVQLDELAKEDPKTEDKVQDAAGPDKAAAEEKTKQRSRTPASQSAAADKPSEKAPKDPTTHTWSPVVRNEAVTKLLALVEDESLDQNSRLEALENAAPSWDDMVEPEFHAKLVKTCIQVAKGYMSRKDALKALDVSSG